MPAIITHDQFGRDALELPATQFITTEQERCAFLLGNQGPDPLFYSVASLRTAKYSKLGGEMHHSQPSAVLCAMANSLVYLPESAHGIAKAYIAGFLCHYLLDRAEHPLVYAQQYALCDAGVDGLDESDGNEVHAIIESDLDEMMLWTRRSKTVREFRPQKEILQANQQTLSIISYLFSMAMRDAFAQDVRPDLFTKSVHGFRHIQGIFHSPHGKKREFLGSVERRFRNHSFVQAMSHRAEPLEQSEFENADHAAWINPFTKEISTASFQDLYGIALAQAQNWIPRFTAEGFSMEDAKELTEGLNFSGDPVE